jgi:prepilin-type N-terminal cleavage/methylation domain-containing protein
MKIRKGFTFVEMLVVMIVLGALSGIAVPRIRDYKERAYVAAMQTDLGNLKIAQESYWSEHLQYATDTTSLEFRLTHNVVISITSKDVAGGYTAVATHLNLPGRQCATAMGPEAAPREPGSVACGPVNTGSASIPSTP